MGQTGDDFSGVRNRPLLLTDMGGTVRILYRHSTPLKDEAVPAPRRLHSKNLPSTFPRQGQGSPHDTVHRDDRHPGGRFPAGVSFLHRLRGVPPPRQKAARRKERQRGQA